MNTKISYNLPNSILGIMGGDHSNSQTASLVNVISEGDVNSHGDLITIHNHIKADTTCKPTL